MDTTCVPCCDGQLHALQGTWQNIELPNELYLVQDRTVSRVRQSTSEKTVFNNVLVVDKVHDRIQWGVKGKFILGWVSGEECAGLLDEVSWTVPGADTRAPGGRTKEWRWKRLDSSALPAETFSDSLVVVAAEASPEAFWPLANAACSSSIAASTTPSATAAESHLSQPGAVPGLALGTPPSAPRPVAPRPPSCPPPPHLVAPSQALGTEPEVVAAIQGHWLNSADSTESYRVCGLDVARHKASRMEVRTFRLRWNAASRRIEWGLGKYFLQPPTSAAMPRAVWTPSDGRGRGFSWTRAGGRAGEPPVAPTASGLGPAALSPLGLVSTQRPPAPPPPPPPSAAAAGCGAVLLQLAEAERAQLEWQQRLQAQAEPQQGWLQQQLQQEALRQLRHVWCQHHAVAVAPQPALHRVAPY
ncbi:unnamed protein product [Prorocentrum cordatum]|uniref:Uncharacterized protein n=1 Tax=Prorocentrum cordatum TaxID=2364126 RepID=A0ABN9XVH4_9DINO|nr:unnamed protein product [Polarella glacialis]